MTELRLPNIEENQDIKNIIILVQSFLCEKALKENKKQDEMNKTTLGNINFWFVTGKDKKSYLVYDSNPMNWTKKTISKIKNDIDHHNWSFLQDKLQLW